MSNVFEALSLLTPFDIDKPKVRLGPAADGGYVFVDDISPSQALVSYGIADEYNLERLFAEAGHLGFHVRPYYRGDRHRLPQHALL